MIYVFSDYFSHLLINKPNCIPVGTTFLVPRCNAKKKKKLNSLILTVTKIHTSQWAFVWMGENWRYKHWAGSKSQRYDAGSRKRVSGNMAVACSEILTHLPWD